VIRGRWSRAPEKILPFVVAAWLALPTPAVAARRATVRLRDYISNARPFLPTEGSGTYVVPSPQDREVFRAAATALVNGDATGAEQALADYPDFEVLEIDDAPAGGTYLALVEKPPVARGWGFFFFAREPLRPQLVLEAPHPIADRDSELATAISATALRPAAVLFAGAHRYANPAAVSDVAHVSDSVFEAVHEAVMATPLVTVQIHGFSAAGHAGYPEVLLSSGSVVPGRRAKVLCDAMVTGGLGCTLFDGSAYLDLGAQTNMQASQVRRAFGSGHFLHLETADTVRDDPRRLAVVIDAIAAQSPSRPPPPGCAISGGDPAGAWPVLVAGLVWCLMRRRPASPPS
jgi:uncharacterized protein (TIGR03382 family)